MPKRILRVATFDFGGLRSLSQLHAMKFIMHRVRCIEYPGERDRVVLPCEYFDLIGGSDTGGLITIMFVTLRMSAEEALNEFCIITQYVYKKGLEPKERTERLKECMESLLIKKGFPPELNLEAEDQDRCLGLVLTMLSANHTNSSNLRTYFTWVGPPTGITVVDAVLATCASPEFLPVLAGSEIECERLEYIGAGIGASNPIRQVREEVYLHFGKDSIVSLLLSVGSGHPGIATADGAHDSQYPLMLDCEKFSVTQGMETNRGPADSLNIYSQSHAYLTDPNMSEQIDQCVSRMRRTKGLTASNEIVYVRHSNWSTVETSPKEPARSGLQSLEGRIQAPDAYSNTQPAWSVSNRKNARPNWDWRKLALTAVVPLYAVLVTILLLARR